LTIANSTELILVTGADCSYSPADPAVQECPYPYYDSLRSAVRPYRIAGTDHYVLTRYEDVVFAARHPELFSNRKYWQSDDDPDLAAILARQRFAIEPALVDNDPPSHTVYRRIASRAFTPGRLRAVEPLVRDRCADLIQEFAGEPEIEFVERFCKPLPMRVVCDLLGIPRKMGHSINRWSEAYLALAGRQLPKDQAQACQSEVVDFNNYIAELLEERLASPTDDVVTELTQAETPDGRRLDMVELSAILRNLMSAAGETTAFMLGNTMLQLLENPDEEAKVRADPALIPRMIEESLRRESPQQWNWRMVLQDTEIGGTTIPAGSWVHLVWAAANREPAVFADPERFDPGRPNTGKQLAFGLGIHFCLGAPLARMEGRIAYECLLERFSSIRLADRVDAIVRRHAATSRSLEGLHLTLTPA
jgi:cytochrome P450